MSTTTQTVIAAYRMRRIRAYRMDELQPPTYLSLRDASYRDEHYETELDAIVPLVLAAHADVALNTLGERCILDETTQRCYDSVCDASLAGLARVASNAPLDMAASEAIWSELELDS